MPLTTLTMTTCLLFTIKYASNKYQCFLNIINDITEVKPGSQFDFNERHNSAHRAKYNFYQLNEKTANEVNFRKIILLLLLFIIFCNIFGRTKSAFLHEWKVNAVCPESEAEVLF